MLISDVGDKVNYWVVKGRPDENDFDTILVPNEEQAWRTRRPLPKQLAEGDFVFIWASSPWREFVGLAQFRSSIDDKDKDGNNRFLLKYISPRLTRPMGIEALRDDATLNKDGVPSFLKAGAAGTIFPLTTQQGQRIRSLLVASNPSLSSSQSSRNLCASDVAEPPNRIEVTISRIIRDTAKSRSLKTLYAHMCQVCQLVLPVSPGIFYIEAHHIRPLGAPHSGSDEHDNMIVLCPTHHAMFDLAITRFVSDSEIAIFGSVHRLDMRHSFSQSSIVYHNELYDMRELRTLAGRTAPACLQTG